MTLASIWSLFIEFLYPKTEDVYKLESLSPGELLGKLPPAQDLGESTLALFAYGDPLVRSIVHELKYRHNTALTKSLAVVLMDTLRGELAERALSDNFHTPLLIPMPMSPARRKERGWNQTEVICQELIALDTENIFQYAPHTLSKIKHTESQARIANKKIRLSNVAGSMRVEDPELTKGRCIVLLDDVTTTGATFAEAKKKLRECGASKILCIAIAH